MNKRIGLLIRYENTVEENKYYIKAIEKFNGEVVLINDTDILNEVFKKLEGVEGIVLTGGYDVGRLDYTLIKYALDNNLKILGICQGMQSMALYGSDNKLLEIGNDSHSQKEGYVHGVRVLKGRFLDIVGFDNIDVDSHHKQTVGESKYFNIVGYSDDGLIEVVENSKHKFQIGVQWHPERMIEYDNISEKLIDNFVNL